MKNYIFQNFESGLQPAKHLAPCTTGRKIFCQQLIEYGILNGIFAEARRISSQTVVISYDNRISYLINCGKHFLEIIKCFIDSIFFVRMNLIPLINT